LVSYRCACQGDTQNRRRKVSACAALAGLAFGCAGLLRPADPAQAPAPPSLHFTVASDLHSGTATYDGVIEAIQAHAGGPGVFHVSIGDLADKEDQNPERDAFWDALRRHRVQAFISGHVHLYYKLPKDGVWQIVDGCASRPAEATDLL